MDRHVEAAGVLDASQVEDLRAAGRHLQHLLVAEVVDLAGVHHDSRVGGEDAVDVAVDLADVGVEGRGEGDRRRVGATAAQCGDVLGVLADTLEPGDDGDVPRVEGGLDPAGGDVDDAGLAVDGVGDHAGLAAGEGPRLVAQVGDGHRQQGHRDALAAGQEDVELAAGREWRDLVGEVEELVRGVAHGGDDDADRVAGLARLSTIRRATRLMLSASATEEPPYFCTTRLTATLLFRRHGRGTAREGPVIGAPRAPHHAPDSEMPPQGPDPAALSRQAPLGWRRSV